MVPLVVEAEREAYGLRAESQPLVRLGDTEEEKSTCLGDMEIWVFLR